MDQARAGCAQRATNGHFAAAAFGTNEEESKYPPAEPGALLCEPLKAA
jgi:hypothetical protein